ncbi:band 3 anion transport protein isoform X2 [Lepeophtheirus salmonis]|uniref:band 3 anion transport protein isoform X2 n=1 Tax=Lepeophtheirus salmonis TaxID=72036 RepID=UPI001AEACFCD|nr:band 3 anion exchange protein-like isoform X2 [Lepeophtheirus salmonis]
MQNNAHSSWSQGGTNSKNEGLDRACDKIFHPEKFDAAKFTKSGESNLDEGASFFYKNMSIASETALDPYGRYLSVSDTNSPTEGTSPHTSRPPFIRSASLVEAPLPDFLINNQTQNSWTNYKNHHHQRFYAHNKAIMSKMRSKNSAPQLKRAQTEKAISFSQNMPPKKFSDKKIEKLPTIQDESKVDNRGEEPYEQGYLNPSMQDDFESKHEPNEKNKEFRPVSPAFLIFSESHEGSQDFPSMEGQSNDDDKPAFSRKVSFHVGHEDEDDYFLEDTKESQEVTKHRSSSKKKKKHSYRHALPLDLRRRVGSELAMEDNYSYVSDEDLQLRDVENLASHRNDDLKALHRHKIKKDPSKISMYRVHRKEITEGTENKLIQKVYGIPKKEFDHSPHDLFVEMDVLQEDQWVEMARWIKYEEDREEGSERWGKAHVSSLSFHSLINLRLCLEGGIFMFDMEAKDLTGVVYRVVEEFGCNSSISESEKSDILRVLLYRHKYVTDNHAFKFHLNRRHSNTSLKSLMTLEDKIHKSTSAKILQRPMSVSGNLAAGFHSLADMKMKDDEKLDIEAGDVETESIASHLEIKNYHDKEGILKRLKEGTEGTIVLSGSLDYLKEPMCAFVRLAEGIVMPNALEVPLPMRFIFILLTPKGDMNMDCYEIGRSFSTLMSNPNFHNMCYQVEEKREILSSINEFLDESVVLPPGDWDSKNLLSLQELREIRRKRKIRLEKIKEDTADVKAVAGQGDGDDDPNKKKKKLGALDRFPYPFGGLINDLKTRFPYYLSDITDGFSFQVLAATIFIYFAALSGAIAFGGLTGEKTGNLIGIPETLIVSSIAGIIFALFSGTPLIIVGETGPVLLYDESLYKFTESNKIEFLPLRVWIGVWVFIISVVVAGFQGSTLVKHFTKFTKDIFASLVSLLFIYEAIRKIILTFGEHPLHSLEDYCKEMPIGNYSDVDMEEERIGRSLQNIVTSNAVLKEDINRVQPNTALLSFILMFGTFFLAYYFRILRNGKFFGRTIRRALGDFGVPIAIAIMVLLDFAFEDAYTSKLKVPSGVEVTTPEKRGWVVSPLGKNSDIQPWIPFAAFLPAILLYLLLFMETHICELLMMDKSSKKGNGLHWDIVLLCIINCLGAFFGGPWICAATVRAVAHVSALTIMSTTHAPGESPKIVDVLDQRLSALVVSILVGVSITFSPILKLVPYAVLFGVFLYMGVSSTSGIQFFDRLSLLILPIKHHPPVSYVRRVKTWKMHLYTFCQASGLIILWVVKSTQAALAFPFFVIGMIPFRFGLKFIFTEKELDALDGPKAGQVVTDDEPDFYAQGIGG